MRLVLVLILLLLSVPVFAAPQKHALVIGNAAYKISPLKNPVNDAEDIGKRLQQLGFQVSLLKNANKREMVRGIREFAGRLNQDSVALFYFAGHGIEVKGENFLLPLAADVKDQAEIEFEALNAGRVLAQMKKSGSVLNLVILDACRNNPFASSFRSASRGLARMHAPAGTKIIYATQPGEVAQDGTGRNGLFTQKLLQVMQKPGLKIEQVVKQTAIAVKDASQGQQIPWSEGVILGDFYFIADNKAQDAGQDKQPPAPAQENQENQEDQSELLDRLTDLEFWKWAHKTQTESSYQLYIKKFPQGEFVELARLQLENMKKPEPVPEPEIKPVPIPVPEPEKPSKPRAQLQYYDVSGVEYWDVLNLREQPEPSGLKIGEFAPDARCLIFRGNKRYRGNDLWIEVEDLDKQLGWVNISYLKPGFGCADGITQNRVGPGYYLVSRDVNLHQRHGFNTPVLRTLRRGTCLRHRGRHKIHSSGMKWLGFRNQTVQGWVPLNYLKRVASCRDSNSMRPGGYYRVVNVAHYDSLNMRSAPGSRNRLVGRIPHNASCVLGLNHRSRYGRRIWMQVSYAGRSGWVNSKYLKPDQHCGRR